MIRPRFVFAATLLGASLTGAAALAQAPAPKFEPILSGKEFVAPLRGKASIEFTKPATRREKDLVVTTVMVKNVSDGPIARLTIEEIWYDRRGEVVGGGRASINGVLGAGKVETVRIETPYNPQFNSNNYRFTHANGSVDPMQVGKIDDPDAAAKAAAAKQAASKR